MLRRQSPLRALRGILIRVPVPSSENKHPIITSLAKRNPLVYDVIQQRAWFHSQNLETENRDAAGRIEIERATFQTASFLEMLDILNEQLIAKGEEPVAFDHDCREGICGTCSLMINGRPHGRQGVASANPMRSFSMAT
jgi:hypothetical protein